MAHPVEHMHYYSGAWGLEPCFLYLPSLETPQVGVPAGGSWLLVAVLVALTISLESHIFLSEEI